MIVITIRKNADGVYNGLSMIGHAGYDAYGKDIVCAAVSALVINTVNSMETFTEDVFTLNTDEESGMMEFEVVSAISKETRLLLDSLLLGLRGIEENYGNTFISIQEKQRIDKKEV